MPEQQALDHQPTRPPPGGAFSLSGGDLAEAAGSMVARSGAARSQPIGEGGNVSHVDIDEKNTLYPRSRGLSEHGVFSCEECCIPAHMQGWGYQ
jgi:hypothetical protein